MALKQFFDKNMTSKMKNSKKIKDKKKNANETHTEKCVSLLISLKKKVCNVKHLLNFSFVI